MVDEKRKNTPVLLLPTEKGIFVQLGTTKGWSLAKTMRIATRAMALYEDVTSFATHKNYDKSVELAIMSDTDFRRK